MAETMRKQFHKELRGRGITGAQIILAKALVAAEQEGRGSRHNSLMVLPLAEQGCIQPSLVAQ
jgi:hypothetical protein